MTEDRLTIAERLAKSGDEDFLRAEAESVLQLLMEADIEGLIGAGRHERSAERTTWRNDYRDRTLETCLGPFNLKVPKLRQGSYVPGVREHPPLPIRHQTLLSGSPRPDHLPLYRQRWSVPPRYATLSTSITHLRP